MRPLARVAVFQCLGRDCGGTGLANGERTQRERDHAAGLRDRALARWSQNVLQIGAQGVGQRRRCVALEIPWFVTVEVVGDVISLGTGAGQYIGDGQIGGRCRYAAGERNRIGGNPLAITYSEYVP